jgi:nucleotide-binding universal stress UspA family protein
VAYKTIMVQMGLRQPSDELLRVAAHLRERFEARMIGVAACQPVPMVYGDGYSGFVDTQTTSICEDVLQDELRAAEAQFRAELQHGSLPIDWRQAYSVDAVCDYLASEARCADLVMTSATTADPLDAARHASLGELILRAGRPVLVVPGEGARIPFERIVIAWSDTREARRAVCDAVPLLRQARQVTVVEIAAKAAMSDALVRVQDVAQWLAGHGISAAVCVAPAHGASAATLDAILAEQDADLVVAGAYGHSRLREWAFGGVTHSLLRGGRCALLSH